MSFKKELEKKIKGITPSLQVLVYHKGVKTLSLHLGKNYRYYDWASITKAVFTISAVMKIYEKDPTFLDKRVFEILPWFKNKKVKIYQLLNHTSGLYWWRPFYKSIDLSIPPVDRWMELRKQLRNEKSKKGKHAEYSDLNYFILGFVLESVYNKSLIEIWEDLREELGFKETDFNFLNRPKFQKKQYAPTEYCPWRKKRLQGQVHDENTFALGGISTHAGLFGPITELAQFGMILRKTYKGKKTFIKPSTLKKFMRSTIRKDQWDKGNWAMGFMMPAMENSSAGNYFSKKSIGFLGFTGTSFWYDPEHDLWVGIFSNRVFYGREKKGIMDVRRFIHDEVFKKFVGV